MLVSPRMAVRRVLRPGERTSLLTLANACVVFPSPGDYELSYSHGQDKAPPVRIPGRRSFALSEPGFRGRVIGRRALRLQGTPGLAGATITGDGRIALILDLPTLIRHYARRNYREVA